MLHLIEVRQTAAFTKWLGRLRDRTARAHIVARIRRVETGNIGKAETVGEGVSELKIHYGPGYRLYFVRQGTKLVILLCGGDKSSQGRDIAKAKALAKEL